MSKQKEGQFTFTFGRKPSEVLKIFDKLSSYLNNHTGTSISSDWNHSITLESESENSEHVLTIYQLKSTRQGVSLPKTIQMFTDQTIRISLESKDCTDALINGLTIETPDDLMKLIERVSDTSVCTGCPGFETILRCRRATREGSIWYSAQCNRLVPIPTGETNLVPTATCKPCRAIRLSLRNQKAKMMSEISAKEKEQTMMSPGMKNLHDLKDPNVQNIIQERLRGVWNALGYDEVSAGKWLPPAVSKPLITPIHVDMPSTSARISEIVTLE